MKKTFLPKVIFTLAALLMLTLGTAFGQTWNRVDISDLTSTDIFVIVDTSSSRAMINSNGASSAPTAVLLTLNGDKSQIDQEVPDNCKWNISGDGDDGYIFYPNGSTTTWLYCTNTNNGVRVGTNNNKLFVIDENYLKNTGTNRYIGIYNNQDWRCYTGNGNGAGTGGSNIENTRTCFFKYTEVQSDVPTPTISLASGTYFTAQTVTLACTESAAVIHYTLDGTQPDETSPVYSEAITITQSTTLKAVAALNGELSAVATAHYTFPIDAADLATLRQGATDGTLYRYTGNATVTFANNNRHAKYIQDATAAILIDDNSGNITSTYVQGDVMTGVVGTLQVYQGMLQFVPSFDPGEPIASGSTIVPPVLTCDELLADAESYEAQLITLTNVVISTTATTFTGATYYNLNGNSNPKMGVRYSDLDLVGEDIPTVAQNITGVIFDYNGTYEIFPRSMADLEDYEIIPVEPDTFAITFSTDGYTDYVAPIIYIEGDAAVELPYIPGCKAVNFIGWSSTEIEGSEADLASVDLIEGDFTPTQDIMLYAVFSVMEEVIVYVSHLAPDTLAYENTVCQGQPYDDGDFIFAEPVSGSYFMERESEVPYCHTVLQLDLTVLVPDITDLYAQICSGETYNQNGFNETEAGDYQQTLSNAAGCDSIVWLHLTVGSATVTELTDAVCQNSHYTENGFDIEATEIGAFDYYDTIERPGTCDSIVHLALTVNATYYEEVSDEACGEYLWNEETYTESGTYTWNGQTVNGCDSTVVLTLTIHPTATLTITDEACSSYTWNENVYTESGEYTWVGQTLNGCDSTVTLQLTIHQPDVTEFEASSVDSYEWNSEQFTESGDYTRTFTNLYGCDSVVTLHLTITHNYTVTFDVNGNTTVVPAVTYNTADAPLTLPTLESCSNMSFIGWSTDNQLGNNPTIVSTLVPTGDITLYAVFAHLPELDSIVITRASFATVAAYGTPDEWQTLSAVNGTAITGIADLYTNGTYMQMRGTAAPHPYNVTELPGNILSISIIGAGTGSPRPWTPYLANIPLTADNFSSEGTSLNTQTAADNSSEVRWDVTTPARYFYLSLSGNAVYVSSITVTYTTGDIQYTLNPTEEVVLNETICGGQTYNDNIFNESEAGTYEATIPGEGFCATHYTLNLTVNQPVTNEITETACDEFEWQGETLTTSGDYTVTFTAANGCDSTVTLHLTINNSVLNEMEETACNVFEWQGENLTTSGDYTATFTAANGCDSTVILHLTINTSDTTDIYEQICSGDSYTENGFNETETGDYQQNLTNAAGCDSIVRLHLTVGDATVTDLTAEVCQGTHYTENGFDIQADEVGVFEHSLTIPRPGTCDSIVNLVLTVNQPVTNEISETACSEFEWQGETLTTSGDYTATFTAANGCDSTVTLHLTINNSVTNEISETACNEFEWQGETLTTSGDYTATFTAANGCDSTVTLHLTINTPVTSEITETACNEFEWQGETLTTSGDYTATFTAANGCDSTVTLHLTINTPVTSEITETACNEFEWQGETLTTSGDYTATLTAANGCDSTVTLHLTINQPVTATDSINICESELPYTWNGVLFEDEGTESVTLTASNGCDSLVTMTLTVTRINTEVERNSTPENFNFLSAIQDNAEYQWIDCSTNEPIEGATQQQFFPVVSGNYACIITLGACTDTTECVDVTVGIYEMCCGEIRCYPNPTTGMVNVQCTMNNVQLENAEIQVLDMYGRLLHVETMHTSTMQIDLSSYANGIYLLRWVDEGNLIGTTKLMLTR